VQRTLAPGEAVLVDAGCLVALSPSVDYSVKFVGSVRRALFAGEGAFMARLSGGDRGGLVMLQSVREHGTGRVGGGSERGSGSHRRVIMRGFSLALRGRSRAACAARRGGVSSASVLCTLVLFVVMAILVFLLAVFTDDDEQPQQHAQPRRHWNVDL
jgi:hypothetical protein